MSQRTLALSPSRGGFFDFATPKKTSSNAAPGDGQPNETTMCHRPTAFATKLSRRPAYSDILNNLPSSEHILSGI